MQFEINHLRFLSPEGDFITSPEGHQHVDVVHEQSLSDKEGFTGIIDIVKKGFAIIAVCGSMIMISHSIAMTSRQKEAVKSLKSIASSYEIIISQEEVPEIA